MVLGSSRHRDRERREPDALQPGWVQFGYRFSNDGRSQAAPRDPGLARYGVRWWTVGLVAISIVINAWGPGASCWAGSAPA
jgi:hypothetical protein